METCTNVRAVFFVFLTCNSQWMSESCCNTHHRCLQTLGTKQLRLIKLLKGIDCHLYFVLHRTKKQTNKQKITSTTWTSAVKGGFWPIPSCPNALEPHDSTRPESVSVTTKRNIQNCQQHYTLPVEYELRPKLLCSAIYSIQFICRRKGYILDN